MFKTFPFLPLFFRYFDPYSFEELFGFLSKPADDVDVVDQDAEYPSLVLFEPCLHAV